MASPQTDSRAREAAEARGPGSLSGTSLGVTTVSHDLQAFLGAAEEFQKHILLEPSFGSPVGEDRTIVDLPTLLGSIRSSSKTLLSALSFISSINDLGKADSGRSLQAGGELIPVAVEHINRRMKGGQSVSPGEARLVNIYARTYGKLKYPDWYTASKSLFEVSGNCGDLPGPDAYIRESEKLEAQASQLCERYDDLRNEFLNLNRAKGPTEPETEKARADFDNYSLGLDKLLDKAGDVEPKFVGKCCENLKVEVSARPEIVEAALSLCSGLGQIIEYLTIKNGRRPAAPTLDCVEILGVPAENGTHRIAKQMAHFSFNASALLSDDNNTENLAVLLQAYVDLRHALARVSLNWPGAAADPERRGALAKLNNTLGGVIVGDAARSREIFLALAEMKHPAIEKLLSTLLTSEVVSESTRGRSLSPFLERSENIQLLGQALSIQVNGNEECAAIVRDGLKNTTLNPVCELGSRIRGCIATGDSSTLARLFDERLEKVFNEISSSVIAKAVVLHALMLAADDDNIRPGLKGRLKSLERVNELASSLSRKTGEKSPEAVFIERLRAKISRRFSYDLSDYWGQREMVAEWREFLQEHLLLLANPQARRGIVPSQVFLNGYLLYGEPGAGKTFLVTCMANELEIPLVKISREEISGAMEKARAAAANKSDWDDKRFEVAFAEFMQEKIQEAERDRQKSGARACMLLVDEMEAEFLKRDPQTGSRSELTRTNIMLRVIESLITKHPEIIFVAATNHIELVDSAALRLGRYGIHLPVRMPNKDDVLDILNGSYTRLGVSGGKELEQDPAFQKLVETCIGMSPLAIQLAVNNTACLRRIELKQEDIQLDDQLLLRFQRKAEKLKKLDYRAIKALAAAA